MITKFECANCGSEWEREFCPEDEEELIDWNIIARLKKCPLCYKEIKD